MSKSKQGMKKETAQVGDERFTYFANLSRATAEDLLARSIDVFPEIMAGTNTSKYFAWRSLSIQMCTALVDARLRVPDEALQWIAHHLPDLVKSKRGYRLVEAVLRRGDHSSFASDVAVLLIGMIQQGPLNSFSIRVASALFRHHGSAKECALAFVEQADKIWWETRGEELYVFCTLISLPGYADVHPRILSLWHEHGFDRALWSSHPGYPALLLSCLRSPNCGDLKYKLLCALTTDEAVECLMDGGLKIASELIGREWSDFRSWYNKLTDPIPQVKLYLDLLRREMEQEMEMEREYEPAGTPKCLYDATPSDGEEGLWPEYSFDDQGIWSACDASPYECDGWFAAPEYDGTWLPVPWVFVKTHV